VDPLEFRTKLGLALLLFELWMFLALLPLFFAGVLDMPPKWLWWYLAALLAYFSYTGVRAWNRGWKSRFVLRIVVPVLIFALSCIGTCTWLWVLR
jgi:hypothetical protein